MNALLLALGLFVAASAAHVVVWKLRVPRRQTRTILLIHVCTLIAGCVLFGGTALSYVELSRTALLFLTLTAAYIISYSAVEAESPSLVIALRVAAAGPGGLRKDALAREMSDEFLILPRIEDLLRDKMARKDADRYRLTPKGRAFVGIFVRWRRLLRLPRGG
jgi:hypothetical protein